jgi:elongation factor Ts
VSQNSQLISITRERECTDGIYETGSKNEGKPENILAGIIEGKMKKFVEEGTLLTQPFVVNPEQTIEQYLGGDVLVGFKRYSI